MVNNLNTSYKHRRLGGRRGKMRLAHHLVWEAFYGPIETGYQIHHIDGNKQNNDIENLLKLTTSDHQKMHSPYYFKIEGKWIRFCKACKQINNNETFTSCKDCRAREARIERRQNT